MNKTQKQWIERVIRKAKKTVRGRYYGREDGDVCVIGALAAELKIPRANFKGVNTQGIDCCKKLQCVRDALWHHFGLDVSQLSALQSVNDTPYSDTERRRRLLAKLEEFKVEPGGEE